MTSTNASRPSILAPTDRDGLDILRPTSARWNEPATVYELAGVATKDCGHPVDDECDHDCAVFVAEAHRLLFSAPIMCRPACEWGAA